MKKQTLLALVTLVQLFVFAQSKTTNEPFMTRSLSSESIKHVRVQTSGGSISVTGVSPSEARIEVYISGNSNKKELSKEEIQQRLNDTYDLNIDVKNGELVAIAKPKEKITDWTKALNISFRVFSPKNISTDLTTSGGSISLGNLSGKLDFTTSGGSLDVRRVSGNVSGRTSGGSIHVEDANDEVELTTSGGSIEAKNCEGNLRLTTSGGSVELASLKGKIEATTSGGSIEGKDVEGELIATTSGGSIRFKDLSCSLETATSGGAIEVSMKELGKYVRISNSAGNIDLTLPKNKGLDLDLSGRIAGTHLDNFSGQFNEKSVNGKLNGGGVPVRVTAGNGRVSLSLK
jgi:Putative adhesin